MEKQKILVLCTGNSCRSQMAHGYLADLLKAVADVYSAGTETHGVNPRAIQVMKEDGIDIGHHTSNNVLEYEGKDFDFVVTVCDNAKEACPVFLGGVQKLHQSFADPAKATGSEEDILTAFRAVRNDIKYFCETFQAHYYPSVNK